MLRDWRHYFVEGGTESLVRLRVSGPVDGLLGGHRIGPGSHDRRDRPSDIIESEPQAG